ncbi:MAG: ATP-dependent RecD-like DNA helicase [Azonexus sp.]
MSGGFAFDDVVTVERILSSLERGCIFSGRLDDGKKVRVRYVGNGVLPVIGDCLAVKGQWQHYRDRRGITTTQVDSRIMKRHIPKGELLAPWLNRLPNIGTMRAQRLTTAFGHDLPEILRDSTRLADVAHVIEPGKPALAARIAAQIYAALTEKDSSDQSKVDEMEFLTFLEKVGIRDTRVANQLWRFMQGPEAIGRLLHNPYLPAHLIPWKTADQVGCSLLRQAGETQFPTHPERLQGAMASVWRELIAEGDSAAPIARIKALLRNRDVDPDAALDHLQAIGNLRERDGLLRAPGAAWIEDQVVALFERIELHPPSLAIPAGESLLRLILAAESTTGLTLTDEQRGAVGKLLHRPLGVLQGGAGVGKTTVMKVLALSWEQIGGNVVMGALAGKAALQLSRGASTPSRPRIAYTLARLIGMLEKQQSAENGTGQPPEVTLDAKSLLVIDEAGMMDTPTLRRILRLLPDGVRILLAGDDGQLFPISFGKVFHDLVAEGSRVARLTKVLRQAEDSAIPRVAGLIREGQVPDLKAWAGESQGVYRLDPARREAAQRMLRARGELMVVAARRATVDGINETESQARRTPETMTRRLGPLAAIANGDPVVITANRYKDGLFNGLLGVVTAVAPCNIQIHFDGEAEPRQLPEDAETDVELAYAITCHKAQGSSSDVVIILVEKTQLVTREWLYTAITRGKHLVLLVEDDFDSIAQAVSRRTARTTGLLIESVRKNDPDSVR